MYRRPLSYQLCRVFRAKLVLALLCLLVLFSVLLFYYKASDGTLKESTLPLQGSDFKVPLTKSPRVITLVSALPPEVASEEEEDDDGDEGGEEEDETAQGPTFNAQLAKHPRVTTIGEREEEVTAERETVPGEKIDDGGQGNEEETETTVGETVPGEEIITDGDGQGDKQETVTTEETEKEVRISENGPIANCSDQMEVCTFRSQILSAEDHRLMVLTLQQCVNMLNRLKGTAYFLYNTSLIGYYRHNASFIPWGDVIQLALIPLDKKKTSSSTARLISGLKKSKSEDGEYLMRYEPDEDKIFCYNKNSQGSKGETKGQEPLSWPFVEIQIMKMKPDEKGVSTFSASSVQHPTGIVLPLKQVIFEGIQVNVPRDIQLVLDQMDINLYTCTSRSYNHKEGHNETLVSLPCKQLRSFVDFTSINLSYDMEEMWDSKCALGKTMQDPELCAFLPTISQEERAMFRNLFAISFEMLEKIKDAKYYLYAGTLIGYWRHNGTMIPWDDDADIALVPTNPDREESFYVEQLEKLIANYPGYSMHHLPAYHFVKIYGTQSNNSRRIIQDEYYEWRWPFVDIMLMDVTFDKKEKNPKKILSVTHTLEVLDYDPVTPGDLIFPLKRTTFESIPAWVPGNIPGVLGQYYDISKCYSTPFNHRFEHRLDGGRVVWRPCKKLAGLYQFTNLDTEETTQRAFVTSAKNQRKKPTKRKSKYYATTTLQTNENEEYE